MRLRLLLLGFEFFVQALQLLLQIVEFGLFGAEFVGEGGFLGFGVGLVVLGSFQEALHAGQLDFDIFAIGEVLCACQLVFEEFLLLEEVILLVFCLGDTGVGLFETLVEALDGVHLQADAIKENLGALC